MIETLYAMRGASRVRVVADSISPTGHRLTTLHCTYPRMIHAEVMTHRVFSRSARSSRAVPVAHLLAESSYVPTFGGNQPGMVATDISPEAKAEAEAIWRDLIATTRDAVEKLRAIGVHKQWTNRPLEAFGWIDTLISSTSWANFHALRDDDGAQPEIRDLSLAIQNAMDMSEPVSRQPGDWHLPYVSDEELADQGLGIALKLSTARCARISYRPFDGDASIKREIERYDALVTSRPVHASPAEHQATPDHVVNTASRIMRFQDPRLHANFQGWCQHRKLLAHESVPG